MKKLIGQMFQFKGDALQLEQEQAIFRILIGTLLIAYLLWHYFITGMHKQSDIIFWGTITYITIAIVVAMGTLRSTRYSPRRRLMANVVDVIGTTATMTLLGMRGIPVIVVFLWFTIGNGLRFGTRPMAISAGLSIVGVIIAVQNSEIGIRAPEVGGAFVLTLIVIPLYVTILRGHLDKAREIAAKANQAKTEFFARMSHDLRTPLIGIIATTEVLTERRGLSLGERDLFQMIEENATVSLRQVDNVLDFSKIEAGKLVLTSQPLSIPELISSSLRMMRMTARDKSLRLVAAISAGTPLQVLGDQHHLRMVLLNLLANAVKFTNRGYVAVKVQRVSVDGNRALLRFTVADTGIGIATQELEHIWDMFHQENDTIYRQFGGTGLGTTIAKQLVELMGGRIGVVSMKGKGSTFWFEIPLTQQTGREEDGKRVRHERVLILTREQHWAERVRQRLCVGESNVLCVGSLDQLTIELSKTSHCDQQSKCILLVDEEIVVSAEAIDEVGILDMVNRSGTASYLLARTGKEDDEVWARGYCGVLEINSAWPTLEALTLTSPAL